MELIKSLWFNYLIYCLDIAAVAYVFYRLILLIKGTRAVQILLGILTLIVITFIAKDVLHLKTLAWILDKFWLAGVVILAVAFQPEIRAVLASLGSHRWGRLLVPSEFGFVDEIVEAVKQCRHQKLGALIVLEQDTGLRSQIETGTVINAQVSWELILSIFNTRSPLHDGAVIIENTRLIAAGCVLPLSHEQGISKVLGTRHRAALGLSELSDAITIVVSEETGNVSMTRGGRIETGIEPDELRHRLYGLYKERAENTLLSKISSK